jgi:hypothetical protein
MAAAGGKVFYGLKPGNDNLEAALELVAIMPVV